MALLTPLNYVSLHHDFKEMFYRTRGRGACSLALGRGLIKEGFLCVLRSYVGWGWVGVCAGVLGWMSLCMFVLEGRKVLHNDDCVLRRRFEQYLMRLNPALD